MRGRWFGWLGRRYRRRGHRDGNGRRRGGRLTLIEGGFHRHLGFGFGRVLVVGELQHLPAQVKAIAVVQQHVGRHLHVGAVAAAEILDADVPVLDHGREVPARKRAVFRRDRDVRRLPSEDRRSGLEIVPGDMTTRRVVVNEARCARVVADHEPLASRADNRAGLDHQ